MRGLLFTFSFLIAGCSFANSQRDRCPAVRCLSRCEQYEVDQNGCRTCNCVVQAPICPVCDCPEGQSPTYQSDVLDVNGCPTCTCTNLNIKFFPCPRPGCPARCQYAAYDQNFCTTCECLAERPQCPTCTCPDEGIPTPQENARDLNGCPQCACAYPIESRSCPARVANRPCPQVRVCNDDSQCSHGQLCCDIGCGRTCTDPAGVITRPAQTCETTNCRSGTICKMTSTGPKCVRAKCPRLPGGMLRPMVCYFGCSQHSDCSGEEICCSDGPCDSRCQAPADPCPVYRCLPCPEGSSYRTYDRNGCETCECTSEPPYCPRCICPAGWSKKQPIHPIRGNCNKCECTKDGEDSPIGTETCSGTQRCGPNERCEVQTAPCFFPPCPRMEICIVDNYVPPIRSSPCFRFRCRAGEHCEMQNDEPCLPGSTCNKYVCVSDAASTLRCEMSQGSGIVSTTPVVYFKPSNGCPSGSKLTRVGSDGTELCCKTSAVYSDKPACESGSRLFSSLRNQCGNSTQEGTHSIFRWFNRNQTCRAGTICTEHVERQWSVCCPTSSPIWPFSFNVEQS